MRMRPTIGVESWFVQLAFTASGLVWLGNSVEDGVLRTLGRKISETLDIPS